MKNKTTFLRAAAGVLSAVMLCSAVSCGKQEQKNKNENVRTVEPVAVDHVWRAAYTPFPEDLNVRSDSTAVQGSAVVMNGSHIISEDPWKEENVLVRYDLDSGEFTVSPLALPADTPEDAYMQTCIPLADGGTAYLYEAFNPNTFEETYTLYVTDADGQTRFSTDLGSMFDQNNEMGGHFYIRNILAGADGTIYAFTNNAVAAISPEDGHRLWVYSSNDFFDECAVTGDGRVYISFYGMNGMERRFLDNDKKGLGDPFPTPEGFSLPENCRILLGEGYDLYYTTDEGLYAANMTDTEPTLLCSWLNSDLNGNTVQDSLRVISADKLMYTDYDPVTYEPQLAVLTPVAPEDVVPKYLIRLGTANPDMYDLNQKILQFNRASDTYRVVVEDYSQDYSIENAPTAEEKLSTAVASGDVPDMFCFGSGNDAYLFADKGLFCDLSSYLDREDSALRRDDLLPCVLTAMQNTDGTLPLIPDSFTLKTLFMDSAKTNGKSSWTVGDFADAAASLGEGQYLMQLYHLGPQTSASEQLFRTFLPSTLDAFLDRENVTCSFDSEAFGTLLTLCRDASVCYEDESAAELLQNGKLLLYSMGRGFGFGFSDYLQTRYYYFNGQPMTAIGYPAADTSDGGTLMVPNNLYGIFRDSPVADGAWQFLSLLTETGDDRMGRSMGIPVTKAGLDAILEDERLQYYSFEENGWSGTGSDPDMTEEERLAWAKESGGVYGHMTDEDETAIRAMIDGITRAEKPADTTVTDMIFEDASAFFAGAKSLEETQKIIQSRLSIYVSETMG